MRCRKQNKPAARQASRRSQQGVYHAPVSFVCNLDYPPGVWGLQEEIRCSLVSPFPTPCPPVPSVFSRAPISPIPVHSSHPHLSVSQSPYPDPSPNPPLTQRQRRPSGAVPSVSALRAQPGVARRHKRSRPPGSPIHANATTQRESARRPPHR